MQGSTKFETFQPDHTTDEINGSTFPSIMQQQDMSTNDYLSYENKANKRIPKNRSSHLQNAKYSNPYYEQINKRKVKKGSGSMREVGRK